MERTVAEAERLKHKTLRNGSQYTRTGQSNIQDRQEQDSEETLKSKSTPDDNFIGPHGYTIPERQIAPVTMANPFSNSPLTQSPHSSAGGSKHKESMSETSFQFGATERIAPGDPEAVQFAAAATKQPGMSQECENVADGNGTALPEQPIITHLVKDSDENDEPQGPTVIDPDLKKQLDDVNKALSQATHRMNVMKATKALPALRQYQSELLKQLYSRKTFLTHLLAEMDEQSKLEKAQADAVTETWIEDWKEAKMQGFDDESQSRFVSSLTAVLDVVGSDDMEHAEVREMARLIQAITVGELKWKDYTHEISLLPTNRESFAHLLRWIMARYLLNLIYRGGRYLTKVQDMWGKVMRFICGGELERDMSEPPTYGDIGLQGNPPLNSIDQHELLEGTLDEINRREISEGAITRAKILGGTKINEWLTQNPRKHLIDYLEWIEQQRQHDIASLSHVEPLNMSNALEGHEIAQTFDERVDWQQEHNFALAIGNEPERADQGIRWDLETDKPYSIWNEDDLIAYHAQWEECQHV
jgi:hypothetical protein